MVDIDRFFKLYKALCKRAQTGYVRAVYGNHKVVIRIGQFGLYFRRAVEKQKFIRYGVLADKARGFALAFQRKIQGKPAADCVAVGMNVAKYGNARGVIEF